VGVRILKTGRNLEGGLVRGRKLRAIDILPRNLVPFGNGVNLKTRVLLGDMHRVIEGGIRKSGLVLLQMNNIKLALTEERRALRKRLMRSQA
jgi:hypothetical protein